MTAKIHTIDLSQIPVLPPLQMPDTSLFEPSSPISVDSAISRRTSPSPVTSHDTFITAQSSSSALDLNGLSPSASQGLMRSPSPHSQLQSSILRKSISVDSFVHARQPPSRVVRGNTLSFNSEHALDVANDSHQYVSFSTRSPTTRHRMPPPASRSRGTSLSTAVDDVEESAYEESDLERSGDPSKVTRNGKVTQQRAMAPGDLTLPTRLQSVSSVPSMSTSPPSSGNLSNLSSAIVPLRSSSLSHRLSRQTSHMLVNTHPLPVCTSHKFL